MDAAGLPGAHRKSTSQESKRSCVKRSCVKRRSALGVLSLPALQRSKITHVRAKGKEEGTASCKGSRKKEVERRWQDYCCALPVFFLRFRLELAPQLHGPENGSL
eukprot:scaffold14102_cov128-Isochrysis_galbana.AAC.1